MGTHLIAEFLGVEPGKISKVRHVRRVLERVISESGLKFISSSYHQFKPSGVSCVYLLHESHLSVHTWPEYFYLIIDIFSCDSQEKTLKAFQVAKREFAPKQVRRRVFRQELYEKARQEVK